MSIKIGNLIFEGPYKLENFDYIDRACIYVILCKNILNQGYDLIYVGETGELRTRLTNHHKRNCWKNKCFGKLYIAFYLMPSDKYSKENRLKLESELIEKYNPDCNKN